MIQFGEDRRLLLDPLQGCSCLRPAISLVHIIVSDSSYGHYLLVPRRREYLDDLVLVPVFVDQHSVRFESCCLSHFELGQPVARISFRAFQQLLRDVRDALLPSCILGESPMRCLVQNWFI